MWGGCRRSHLDGDSEINIRKNLYYIRSEQSSVSTCQKFDTHCTMFWGLVLEDGKRYNQVAERSYHISMACAKLSTGVCDLVIEHSKTEYVLCLLNSSTPQQSLDINITEGEEVTLFINGKGTVYLSGYYTPDFPMETAPTTTTRGSSRIATQANGTSKRKMANGDAESEAEASGAKQQKLEAGDLPATDDDEEDEDFEPSRMEGSSEEDSAVSDEEEESEVEEPDEDELKGLVEDLNESVSKFKPEVVATEDVKEEA
jgi:hypothetical protein